MQAAFFVAVFCFCKAACALGAGAFGLELGSDIDRYGHEARPVSERWELRMYEVTPPSPDARFDTYAVDTFQGRIIRIMASSADDPSAEASKTLDVFESLKPELMEKYGEPSLNVEDVEDAGSDLRSYLVDEGGMEVLMQAWDVCTDPDEEITSLCVLVTEDVVKNDPQILDPDLFEVANSTGLFHILDPKAVIIRFDEQIIRDIT